jgi:hypothetical protein
MSSLLTPSRSLLSLSLRTSSSPPYSSASYPRARRPPAAAAAAAPSSPPSPAAAPSARRRALRDLARFTACRPAAAGSRHLTGPGLVATLTRTRQARRPSDTRGVTLGLPLTRTSQAPARLTRIPGKRLGPAAGQARRSGGATPGSAAQGGPLGLCRVRAAALRAAGASALRRGRAASHPRRAARCSGPTQPVGAARGQGRGPSRDWDTRRVPARLTPPPRLDARQGTRRRGMPRQCPQPPSLACSLARPPLLHLMYRHAQLLVLLRHQVQHLPPPPPPPPHSAAASRPRSNIRVRRQACGGTVRRQDAGQGIVLVGMVGMVLVGCPAVCR